MLRTILPLAALGPAAVLASCAPPGEPEPETLAGLDTGNQCFFTRSIRGYSDAPDAPSGAERIFVDTGASEKFVLEPAGACPDIGYANRIALDNRNRVSLCTGDTATLLVPSATGTDRCLVRVIGRIED